MIRAHLTIDPHFTVGPINRRLFGSFVEHLGRCVYDGIYEPGHASADGDGQTTLTVSLFGTFGYDESGLFEQYMEENPDIRVEVEVIPWAKRMQKMITAVNGGHAPDAAYLGLDFMPQLHALDILEPIDQYLTPEELDDYTSVARESVTIDGRM